MRNEILTTEQLLDAPPPPMLVDGLLARRGVTGLSADPGVGKTFLALEIARAIVTGTKVLDTFQAQRGGVLFVGQDPSLLEYARQMRKVFGREASEIRARWRALQNEQVPPEAWPENPYQQFIRWAIHPGLDFMQPGHLGELIQMAKQVPNPMDPDERDLTGWEWNATEQEWDPVLIEPLGASLIVLDVLSVMHSAKENSNDEMNKVFSGLRLLSEATEAAVLVLHHHSYANEYNQGGRWRGASSQLGQMDGHFELSRGSHGRLLVKVRKFRGIAPSDFAYEMAATEDRVEFRYCGRPNEEALEPVRAWVEAHPEPEFQPRDLAVLGLTKEQVTAGLRALIDQGIVVARGYGAGRVYQKVQ